MPLMDITMKRDVWDMMRCLKRSSMLLIVLLTFAVAARAQCKVYSGNSGYRIAARVQDGRVYAGSSGYTVIARVDGNRILSGLNGTTVLARVDGQRIYGGTGYTVIGRIDGLKIYYGNSGFKIAARGEGCGVMSLVAGAVAACL